jgi:hypothetical protein
MAVVKNDYTAKHTLSHVLVLLCLHRQLATAVHHTSARCRQVCMRELVTEAARKDNQQKHALPEKLLPQLKR